LYIPHYYYIISVMLKTGEANVVPRLWSDFDGTAVELVTWRNPRNWAKYPLSGIAGYIDFLRGVKSEGVDIGGIVTARPNNFQRRRVTARSIVKLGYGDFFNTDNTRLSGSHAAKASFLIDESGQAPVGMIEDLPQHLIPTLLKTILLREDSPRYPLTLGIVDTGHNDSYLEDTIATFDRSPAFEVAASSNFYAVEGEDFKLNLTLLQSYSEEAGRDFGVKLKSSI